MRRFIALLGLCGLAFFGVARAATTVTTPSILSPVGNSASYNAIDATQQTGLSASTTSATFSGTTMTVNTASVGVFTVGMTVTFRGSAGQTITALGNLCGLDWDPDPIGIGLGNRRRRIRLRHQRVRQNQRRCDRAPGLGG